MTGIRRGEHDASAASASSAYGGGEDESAYGSAPRTPYFDSPTETARDGSAAEKGRFETAAGGSAGEKPLPSPTPSAGGLLSPATSDYGFAREQLRTPSPQPGQHVPQYPLSPTLRAMYPHDDDDGGEFGASSAQAAAAESQYPGSGNTLTSATRRRLGAARRSNTNGSVGNTQPFIMRSSAISRTDLIASAERIYTRYLMPGADKEVYLPPSLRITDFPLSRSTLPAVTHPDYDHEASLQAKIPDLFHQQKEFVYRAMEQDSFPRFLRSKAYGNLTPLSAYARLAFGLLALWAAFATGFAFILLDVTPKAKRLWVRGLCRILARTRPLTLFELGPYRSFSPSRSPSSTLSRGVTTSTRSWSLWACPKRCVLPMEFLALLGAHTGVLTIFRVLVGTDSIPDDRDPRAVHPQTALCARVVDRVPLCRHCRHSHAHLCPRARTPTLSMSCCVRARSSVYSFRLSSLALLPSSLSGMPLAAVPLHFGRARFAGLSIPRFCLIPLHTHIYWNLSISLWTACVRLHNSCPAKEGERDGARVLSWEQVFPQEVGRLPPPFDLSHGS